MCKCPSCKSSSRKRISRTFLVKFIVGAKAYKCYRCKSRFVKVPFIKETILISKGIENEIPITG